MLPKKTPEELEKEKQQQEYQLPADLKDYAYNIFPSLQNIVPKRQQMFDDVEAESAEQAQAPNPATSQSIAQSVEQMQPQSQEPVMAQVAAQAEQEAPEQDEMEKAIDRAQEARDRAALFKQMASVRDAVIGAGLGNKFELDKGMYDEMSKEADRPLKNLLAKKEIRQAREKDDPTSQLSQLTRNSLAQLGLNMQGMDKVSYSQLEKLYPSLTQALYVKLKAEADKMQAQSSREAKSEMKELRQEEKNKANYYKTQSGIDRMVGQIQKGKPYVGYEQAKQAKALLLEAANSTDVQKKVQNAAGFMNYAKVAQGDDSVVRSEDMKVLAGSMGYTSVSEMLSKIASRAQGSPFSPAELQMMSKVVDTIIGVKKQALQQLVSPLRKRAESNDYDLSESIDPSLLEEIETNDQPASPAEKLKQLDDKLKANQARIEELRSRKGN
jgi:hypothetical protein